MKFRQIFLYTCMLQAHEFVVRAIMKLRHTFFNIIEVRINEMEESNYQR